MAQKYIVQLVDDLTQQPIEDGEGESVAFGLDGVAYAIDLSRDHAIELRTALERYVAAARRGEAAPRGRTNASRAGGAKSDTKSVREWASKNGYNVSSRGRIPAEIQEAYARR